MKLKLPLKSWQRANKLSVKPIDASAKKIERATIRHAHKFLINRWINLRYIRRHVIAWLLLLALLIGLTGLQITINQVSLSQKLPVGGGTYSEGTLGPIDTLNPLYASSNAEIAANKLIFSSLLAYDTSGRLQGDLAQDWSVSPDGKTYTIKLRPDLRWHDGEPLTTDDVVFTIQTIQNPKAHALNFNSWIDIKVAAKTKTEVVFTLPNSYAPFTSALTFAVLPKHILKDVPPEDLQTSAFSKRPTGSGPFSHINTQTIDMTTGKNAIHLSQFDDYWAGPPQVSRFSLYVYGQSKDIEKALLTHEINAASDISVRDSSRIKERMYRELNIPLNNGVFAILKTDNPILKDHAVRQALLLATSTKKLRAAIGKEALELAGPIVNSGMAKANKISQLEFDNKKAASLLDGAGWKPAEGGVRKKDGQALELRLVSVEANHYKVVVDTLSQQWSEIGVKVEEQIVDPSQVQQTILRPRSYDVLVYELALGGDPDGYAFWHSSQITGTGLNFAHYASPVADDALVTARLKPNNQLRDAKYTSFAQQWVKDIPAIALYRPALHYVTTTKLSSLTGDEKLVSPSDRFADVLHWTTDIDNVYYTP